jgi:hypothetical protein
MRIAVITLTTLLLCESAHPACGSRGGPGIRGSSGRCLSWRDVGGSSYRASPGTPYRYRPSVGVPTYALGATTIPLLSPPPSPLAPSGVTRNVVRDEPKTREGQLALCDGADAEWRRWVAERGHARVDTIEEHVRLQEECRAAAQNLPTASEYHATQK